RRGRLLQAVLRGRVVAKLRRCQPHKITRHISRVRMWIVIGDRLELLARRGGTLLRRGEAVVSRLRWNARRTHRRFKSTDRRRKRSAGWFVLRVDVVPTAKRNRGDDDHRHYNDDEFSLVLLGPVGGVLRCLDRDLAEAVLFQLMPGFCAHRLPSSFSGRMAIVQFNRLISGASKRTLRMVGHRDFTGNVSMS